MEYGSSTPYAGMAWENKADISYLITSQVFFYTNEGCVQQQVSLSLMQL